MACTSLVSAHAAHAADTVDVDDASETQEALQNETAENAQERDDRPIYSEIIVTAQKREESINEVPMSITAATGQELERLGIEDTADLVKIASGLNYNTTAYGAPVYTIRGVGFQDTALASSPTVSVYVDEITRPFSIQAAGAALDIERVEILKGPQGTLYGQNATGGAINYVPNKPTDYFEGSLQASYSRFDQLEVEGVVSGPINSALAYRAAARYVNSGPWQQSYTRAAELGEKDEFDARLSLEWEPRSSVRFLLAGTVRLDNSETPAPQLFQISIQNPQTPLDPAYLSYPRAPRDNRAADWSDCINASPFEEPSGCVPLRKDTEYYTISLRGDVDVSDSVTITSLTSYQDFDRFEPLELDGTTFRNYESIQQGYLKTFYQELRLTGELGLGGNWIVGANYQYDDTVDTLLQSYSASSSAQIFGIPLGPTQPLNEQEINTYAVFGNVEYPIGDFAVHAGLRYTTQTRDFRGCGQDGGDGSWALISQAIQNLLITGDPFVNSAFPDPSQGPGINVGPGGCGTTGPAPTFLPEYVLDSLDEDNLSWRAGVKWEVSPDHLIYANISRGYKAGAFPTAATARSVQLIPAVQESLLAYEMGFKSGFAGGRLQLNGAVFYYDYTDKQIRGFLLDPVFGPLAALVNVPKSHVLGFDASVSATPVDGLTLSGGIAYVKSEIDGNFSNFNYLGQFQNFTGESFPHSPEWQGNANIEYRFEVFSDFEAYLGGNVSYRGKTNAGFGELAELAIKSYTLLDLRAGVENDTWRLQLWGKNVTDTYYYTEVARLFGDSLVRYAGRPATYGVTVGYRF
ncbi:TonB-dependent receptor [Erythrobacter sp.]|uniref:TonB-dependent receptor n=1 Tax=Erythrobacter sp. TaxID=1042 RepID=UPI003C722F73